ncbi:MAG: tetratricopeptide repeat protein [bacterium]|nr:tetratricopeptide repeat protein [bacterium]
MQLKVKLLIFIWVVFQILCTCYLFAQVPSIDSSVMILYRVQIGSYITEHQAQEVATQALKDGLDPVKIDLVSASYKVRVGQYTNYTTAKQFAKELQTRGYPGSYVVSIPLTGAEAATLGLVPERTLYEEATSKVDFTSTRTEPELFTEATSTKDLPLATQNYIELTIRFPESSYIPETKYRLGYSYYRLGQNRNRAMNTAMDDTARRYFESGSLVLREFLSKYPDSEFTPNAQFWLAMTLHKLSRYGTNMVDRVATAAEEFRKVATEFPASSLTAEAQMQYGGLRLELARNQRVSYDTVRIELKKVESLYPKAETATLARAALMYAESYADERKWRDTISAAQTVIEQYPDCRTDVALAKYLIARSYYEIGALRTAKEKYNEILSLYAENQDNLIAHIYASSLFEQAVILYRLGESKRAQSLITELKQKYPFSRQTKLASQIQPAKSE